MSVQLRWYWVKVHSRQSGEMWTVRIGAQSAEQAAESGVVWAFRNLGWHRVLCHPVVDVADVEESAGE